MGVLLFLLVPLAVIIVGSLILTLGESQAAEHAVEHAGVRA